MGTGVSPQLGEIVVVGGNTGGFVWHTPRCFGGFGLVGGTTWGFSLWFWGQRALGVFSGFPCSLFGLCFVFRWTFFFFRGFHLTYNPPLPFFKYLMDPRLRVPTIERLGG